MNTKCNAAATRGAGTANTRPMPCVLANGSNTEVTADSIYSVQDGKGKKMIDAYILIAGCAVILIILIISLTKIENRIAEDRINKMFESLKKRKGERLAMSRYIDANRLIFELYNCTNMNGEYRAMMCRVIQGVPTADVVPKEEMINELIKEISDRVIQAIEANYEIIPKKPVLQCKDCKHYRGLAGCVLIGDCMGTDSFCAWGERREDE